MKSEKCENAEGHNQEERKCGNGGMGERPEQVRRKRMIRREGERKKQMVLTLLPPGAHPSCIHLDGYRRS